MLGLVFKGRLQCLAVEFILLSVVVCSLNSQWGVCAVEVGIHSVLKRNSNLICI